MEGKDAAETPPPVILEEEEEDEEDGAGGGGEEGGEDVEKLPPPPAAARGCREDGSTTNDTDSDGDDSSLLDGGVGEEEDSDISDDGEYDEYDDDDEYDPAAAMFKYDRLFGSLPRAPPPPLGGVAEFGFEGQQQQHQPPVPPLSPECTAASIGRLVLNAESTVAVAASASSAPGGGGGGGNDAPSSSPARNVASGGLATGGGAAQQQQQPASGIGAAAAAAAGGGVGENAAVPLPTPIAVSVVAAGFENGQVWIVDALRADAVATPWQLQAGSADGNGSGGGGGSSGPEIVATSWDSTSTQLAAIDSRGACTIWSDLKYSVVMRKPSAAVAAQQSQNQQHLGASGGGGGDGVAATAPPQQQQPASQQQQQQVNAFRSFMNVFTGHGGGGPAPAPQQQQDAAVPAVTSEDETTATATRAAPQAAVTATGRVEEGMGGVGSGQLVPALTLASSASSSTAPLVQQRVTYPSSFGRPTCMVIDPAYRRRREKSVVVGFESGRLVMTKRGMIFSRRSDQVLYHSPEDDFPIHAATWRGSLLAWADPTGIRLMDVDQMVRIAHVDRPTGARPTLYPSIDVVHPSLCFETSAQLLVAWGDCLLSLRVSSSEQQRRTTSGGSTAGGAAPSSDGGGGTGSDSAAPPPPPRSPSVTRRTVECNMVSQTKR